MAQRSFLVPMDAQSGGPSARKHHGKSQSHMPRGAPVFVLEATVALRWSGENVVISNF
ncbi:hypothetical protein KEM52_003044 [Ascosphaera acerosa]|nr:hypothetical protein KEM52_003044 [Ascosphaera acerosa]